MCARVSKRLPHPKFVIVWIEQEKCIVSGRVNNAHFQNFEILSDFHFYVACKFCIHILHTDRVKTNIFFFNLQMLILTFSDKGVSV